MRNHGDSPHNKVHTYNAMGEDLAAFLTKQGIDDSVLMGHSMGGKAVMNMCLRNLNPVSKLIVVDIAPAVLPLSSDFGSYVKAMDEIQKANLTKRSDADKILAQTEPDIGIRQFLLTNLKKDEQTGLYKFRVPYDILGKSLGNMSDFMEEETQPFEKPTLFIAGGNSGYIKPEKNGPAIKHQFPKSNIKVIKGAGHWGEYITYMYYGLSLQCIKFVAFLQFMLRNLKSLLTWLLNLWAANDRFVTTRHTCSKEA